MRIHHLNCATFCSWGGAVFDGRSIKPTGELVGHVLLIETDAHGLVLVDTGFGLTNVDPPYASPRAFRALLNIKLRVEETAARHHGPHRRYGPDSPIAGSMTLLPDLRLQVRSQVVTSHRPVRHGGR